MSRVASSAAFVVFIAATHSVGCSQAVTGADAARDVRDDVGAIDAVSDGGDIADVPCPWVVCNGRCLPPDVDHCGPSCTQCVRPEWGYVACVDGACVPSCMSGYVLGSSCNPAPPPRPVHPLTNSRMTVRNPTLRWSLPMGIQTAHVRVCADRACTRVEVEFDATGESARVPMELRAGAWFWNVRSVIASGTSPAPSATWMFHTPETSRPVESAWVSRPDVNGDGFDDLVISADWDDAVTAAYVYAGNGSLTAPCSIPAFDSWVDVANPGDVDGDGFTDIIVGSNRTEHRIDLLRGNGDGCRFARLSSIPWDAAMPTRESPFVDVAGDIDRDGFADVLMYSNGIVLQRGSTSGWHGFEPVAGADSTQSFVVVDFDADGYDDLLAAGAELRWWRGTATGPVGPTTIGLALAPRFTRGAHPLVSVGDLDGDGYLDVAHLGSPNPMTTTSDGLSAAVIRGGPSGPSVEPPRPIAQQGGLGVLLDYAGTLGDLDGNGVVDLAVTHSDAPGYLDALLGAAAGYTDASVHRLGFPCAEQPGGARSIGDWNGDGILDGVVLCGGYRVDDAFLLLGVRGGWPVPTPIPTPMTTSQGFGWFVL